MRSRGAAPAIAIGLSWRNAALGRKRPANRWWRLQPRRNPYPLADFALEARRPSSFIPPARNSNSGRSRTSSPGRPAAEEFDDPAHDAGLVGGEIFISHDERIDAAALEPSHPVEARPLERSGVCDQIPVVAEGGDSFARAESRRLICTPLAISTHGRLLSGDRRKCRSAEPACSTPREPSAASPGSPWNASLHAEDAAPRGAASNDLGGIVGVRRRAETLGHPAAEAPARIAPVFGGSPEHAGFPKLRMQGEGAA